jgi:membrane protein DedA with SNARE-associated domain
MTRMKIRKFGLWSGVAALVALGLTVVASNRNLGFGYTITRRRQLSLVAAAITICVVQLVLYLMTHRKEDNAKRDKQP